MTATKKVAASKKALKNTAAPAAVERKRFSFGPVWSAAVVAGTITDHDKLIAHAIKLKVAGRSEATRLKFETLRTKVAAAIEAGVEA